MCPITNAEPGNTRKVLTPGIKLRIPNDKVLGIHRVDTRETIKEGLSARLHREKYKNARTAQCLKNSSNTRTKTVRKRGDVLHEDKTRPRGNLTREQLSRKRPKPPIGILGRPPRKAKDSSVN